MRNLSWSCSLKGVSCAYFAFSVLSWKPLLLVLDVFDLHLCVDWVEFPKPQLLSRTGIGKAFLIVTCSWAKWSPTGELALRKNKLMQHWGISRLNMVAFIKVLLPKTSPFKPLKPQLRLRSIIAYFAKIITSPKKHFHLLLWGFSWTVKINQLKSCRCRLEYL